MDQVAPPPPRAQRANDMIPRYRMRRACLRAGTGLRGRRFGSTDLMSAGPCVRRWKPSCQRPIKWKLRRRPAWPGASPPDVGSLLRFPDQRYASRRPDPPGNQGKHNCGRGALDLKVFAVLAVPASPLLIEPFNHVALDGLHASLHLHLTYAARLENPAYGVVGVLTD